MDRQRPGIMLCGSPPLEHENTSEALKLRDLGETLYFMQSHALEFQPSLYRWNLNDGALVL